MTTEEKAKEVAIKHLPFCGVPITEVVDAALEIAEWKDQQFSIERNQLIEKANQAVTQSFENGAIFKKKDMIDKACEWLELHMQCGVHPQNVASTIKQFKKAMEE